MSKKVTDRDILAQDRTYLANERTFLAYWRTALSFIALGLFAVRFIENEIFLAAGAMSTTFGIALFTYGTAKFFFRKRTVRHRLD